MSVLNKQGLCWNWITAAVDAHFDTGLFVRHEQFPRF